MVQNVETVTVTRTGPGQRGIAAEHAILAEGLVKRYGETTALDGVDLAVRTGTVLGLLGPNGAGKTTAVRVLATLLAPDAGHARVAGFDVQEDAHKVRQLIGLTGQYASVDEGLNGTENLLLIGRLLGLSRGRAKERARELLERFELTDAAGRAAKTYSGGMRRRLDLAASLLGDPKVLFLDEPTTGLDPRSRLELWDLLRGLVADGVTVLLTTQYLDEADALADEIVVVDGGKVIAQGTPEDLKAKVGDQRLEVKALQEADVARVAAVVAAVTGADPEIRGRLIGAPVTETAALAAAVRRLDEAGIAISEVSLRGSSLDEVFLTLTGHRPQDSAAPTDQTEGEPA
jgi:oleandomycin transport system ATP-binding protein